MSTATELSIILNSFFNDTGFKSVKKEIKELKASARSVNQIFSDTGNIQKYNKQIGMLENAGVRVGGKFKDIKLDDGGTIKKWIPKFTDLKGKVISSAAATKRLNLYQTNYNKLLDKTIAKKNKQLLIDKEIATKTANLQKKLDQQPDTGEILQRKLNEQKEINNQKTKESIRLKNKELEKTKALKKELDKLPTSQELNKELSRVGPKTISKEKATTQLISKDKQKEDLRKRFKAVDIDYDEILPENLDQEVKKLTAHERTVKEKTESMKKSFFGFSRAMGSLSILFLSQAMSMAIQRMATSAVQSFMKITEAQGEAAQGMTVLSANMEFLKFTIGNAIATALLPFIPAITNIIQKVSEFIQQHPKLVGLGTVFGFIGFKILGALAQVVLLMAGIQAMTGVKIADQIVTLGGKFTNLGTNIKQAAINALLFAVSFPVLTALIVIVGLLLYNLSQFPDEVDVVKEAFKTLGSGVKTSLQDFGNSIVGIFSDMEISSEGWAIITAASIASVGYAFNLIFKIVTVVAIAIVEAIGAVINTIISFSKAWDALTDFDPNTSAIDTWKESFKGLDNFKFTVKAGVAVGDAWTDWDDMLISQSDKLNKELYGTADYDPMASIAAKAANADEDLRKKYPHLYPDENPTVPESTVKTAQEFTPLMAGYTAPDIGGMTKTISEQINSEVDKAMKDVTEKNKVMIENLGMDYTEFSTSIADDTSIFNTELSKAGSNMQSIDEKAAGIMKTFDGGYSESVINAAKTNDALIGASSSVNKELKGTIDLSEDYIIKAAHRQQANELETKSTLALAKAQERLNRARESRAQSSIWSSTNDYTSSNARA